VIAMARIIDKDTRLIDVEYGNVTVNISRVANQPIPDGSAGNKATFGGRGVQQVIRFEEDGLYSGSFILYERIDLSYMTANNEVMQPVEVSVQRSSPVPYGTHENGNNYDVVQEFLFVFSRPLNNNAIIASANPWQQFNRMGLNTGSSAFGGPSGGGVSHEQNIYAEKRTYVYNSNSGATQLNGELVAGNTTLNSQFGEPQLLNVNTWGSLSAITGPNLHCYRVVIMQAQSFDADATIYTNVGFGGFTTLEFPPLNATFLCKDPKYSEGEYLTRLVNAMNNVQEGDVTFD
jgi:hypothetical protein